MRWLFLLIFAVASSVWAEDQSASSVGREVKKMAQSFYGRSLTRNVLSFGPQTPQFNLCSLNVLIGPNGSGKSNLLEVLALLRSTPVDCRPVILKGGGVTEWIWKGQPHEPASVDAKRDSAETTLRGLYAARRYAEVLEERERVKRDWQAMREAFGAAAAVQLPMQPGIGSIVVPMSSPAD